MIRNASTSSLIASKNGDKEELLILALHLADRLIEDIIPVIVSSIKNTDTEKEVIRCLVIEAIECFECRESFIWRRLEKGEKRIVTCPHCGTRHKLWQQKKNNILRVTNLKYK